jgi:hypothetical protein
MVSRQMAPGDGDGGGIWKRREGERRAAAKSQ